MEEIGCLKLENQTFNVDNGTEMAILNGLYTMKAYLNPHPDLKSISDKYCDSGSPKHLHCKSPYIMGHILYKTDEAEVENNINLLIKATYEDLPPFVDTSAKDKEQMRSGTICPTKKAIFRYKGKLFTVYGRYIYGYDKPYVLFLNKKQTVVKYEDDESDENDEDEYGFVRKDAKLSHDEIILPTVAYGIDIPQKHILDDYNYSFKITDEATGNLDAFAIYR